VNKGFLFYLERKDNVWIFNLNWRIVEDTQGNLVALARDWRVQEDIYECEWPFFRALCSL
jgi:hypothetical protein